MHFSVTILGSSSALPTSHRNPTAQLLNVAERFFLIDCGEGTQLQLRKNKIKFSRINHIFISHLHGDHCFGLIGLISTFGLLGRTSPLTIYAHPELEKVLQPQLSFFCNELSFTIVFVPIDTDKSVIIYSDDKVEVSTIPLDHRIPTCGFLFREKFLHRRLNKIALTENKISLNQYAKVSLGEDGVTSDGNIIPNNLLTYPNKVSRSYAYCSDTAYTNLFAQLINGVSLLFHEATYLSNLAELALKTKHSTALDAARVALENQACNLVIGHFSSRYRDVSPLLAEAQSVFTNTFEAKDGRTFFIHNDIDITISIHDIA